VEVSGSVVYLPFTVWMLRKKYSPLPLPEIEPPIFKLAAPASEAVEKTMYHD
jgi:hypothetical protein